MSKYHEAMLLNPALLFSSVGTNAPEDVKKIQRMMARAGYQHNIGRSSATPSTKGMLQLRRWL